MGSKVDCFSGDFNMFKGQAAGVRIKCVRGEQKPNMPIFDLNNDPPGKTYFSRLFVIFVEPESYKVRIETYHDRPSLVVITPTTTDKETWFTPAGLAYLHNIGRAVLTFGWEREAKAAAETAANDTDGNDRPLAR